MVKRREGEGNQQPVYPSLPHGAASPGLASSPNSPTTSLLLLCCTSSPWPGRPGSEAAPGPGGQRLLGRPVARPPDIQAVTLPAAAALACAQRRAGAAERPQDAETSPPSSPAGFQTTQRPCYRTGGMRERQASPRRCRLAGGRRCAVHSSVRSPLSLGTCAHNNTFIVVSDALAHGSERRGISGQCDQRQCPLGFCWHTCGSLGLPTPAARQPRTPAPITPGTKELTEHRRAQARFGPRRKEEQ